MIRILPSWQQAVAPACFVLPNATHLNDAFRAAVQVEAAALRGDTIYLRFALTTGVLDFPTLDAAMDVLTNPDGGSAAARTALSKVLALPPESDPSYCALHPQLRPHRCIQLSRAGIISSHHTPGVCIIANSLCILSQFKVPTTSSLLSTLTTQLLPLLLAHHRRERRAGERLCRA